ncbi:MFS transporter [Streptomyces malaysiensis subsp. malaysiensis]|uniref:MFS transporter n=1 Tax=Streptomyces malaysiensis TaxID=92644 RepID=UPI000BFDBE73|nr:MFS transporter [Streptomyces malaysiensis]ATL86411.1 major facilitator superfamily permease [Streptomyces malaysiensis]QDL70015.1 MFS transporter [Streptomyces malaysiensis]
MTVADTPAPCDTGTTTTAIATASPHPHRAFALLGAVQITLIFTLAAIAVPLPEIGRAFGLERADLILLSAAYGLTFAGLLLFGGRLSDRYGGRRALTAGLILFAAASAAAPFAPGIGTLLMARFAQGAGAALVAPAAMAVLRAVFPAPGAYGRAMATWGGLSVLGATAGNLLSGVIAALLSWRWSFAVPLAVAVAALALAPRLLPDTAPSRGRALDLPGALLATAGITLASYGLVVTDALPWSSARVLVPLLIGAALLIAFWYAEGRAGDPLLPPRFLLDRRRALALAAIALSACGTAMTFVTLSLHLQQDRDWSPLRTSAAFVPFAIALLASGRAAGPLIARFGPRVVTAAGLATAAAGLVLLALTGLDPHTPYASALLPGLVLLPAGAAASFAGAAVLTTQGVPHERTGLAGGVLNTAMELGPTVFFAIVLTFGGDAVSFAATGAALALVATLNLRVRRSRPPRTSSRSQGAML